MEIIFHFNDLEKMQLGSEITFDSLDFIADQLRNLHLQELKPAVQEEEQPSICIFLAGLEDAMLTSMLMRSLPNSARISSSA
jgi:dsDNA-binding SOS-regulon protein